MDPDTRPREIHKLQDQDARCLPRLPQFSGEGFLTRDPGADRSPARDHVSHLTGGQRAALGEAEEDGVSH